MLFELDENHVSMVSSLDPYFPLTMKLAWPSCKDKLSKVFRGDPLMVMATKNPYYKPCKLRKP